jgi:hypothetical protein
MSRIFQITQQIILIFDLKRQIDVAAISQLFLSRVLLR